MSEVSEIPSRQEMFNRAWNGLKSQGFTRCLSIIGTCTYTNQQGARCAWGWVDPEATPGRRGDVWTLHYDKVGIAATLSIEDLVWARTLQGVHDNALSETLEANLREFARNSQLTIPDET